MQIQKKNDRYEPACEVKNSRTYALICLNCKEQVHELDQLKTAKHTKVQKILNTSEHSETDESQEIVAKQFICKSHVSRIFKK